MPPRQEPAEPQAPRPGESRVSKRSPSAFDATLADDAHGTWPGEGLSAAELVARQNMALAAQGVRLGDTPSLVSEWTLRH